MNTTTCELSLCELALEYAAQGLAVFPVGKDKRPLVAGGFHAATTDEKTIRGWWARWPNANIAAPVPRGYIVADVDMGRGGTLDYFKLREYVTREMTAIVKTGAGWHLWFKLPDDVDVDSLKGGSDNTGFKGLDVRLPGKHYVILPGSVHENGHTYYWRGSARPWNEKWGCDTIPDDMLDALRKPTSSTTANYGEAHGTADYWLSQAVEKVGEGQGRNDTGLWLSCQLRDSGVPFEHAEPILLSYAEAVGDYGDHAYTQDEALKTLRSAFSRPQRQPATSTSLIPNPISAEPSVPFISIPFTSLHFSSFPFSSERSLNTEDKSIGISRQEAMEWMEKVDNMDFSGDARLPGPAQERMRLQRFIFKAVWSAYFPTWPLPDNYFSQWRQLIISVLGVGEEGHLLLDCLYCFMDSPHPKGILKPRAAFEAALRDSLALDQRRDEQRARRMASFQDQQPEMPL